MSDLFAWTDPDPCKITDPLITTQGREANRNGQFLERTVQRAFESYGFVTRRYRRGATGDLLSPLSPLTLVTRVPYRSIFRSMSHSEFVAYIKTRAIRIECKFQDGAGSCDEKFPYVWMNAKEYPENEVAIILGGSGFRKRAVEWLRSQCASVMSKKIHVITMDEVPSFIKREVFRK